jgi:hypothetical protein
MRRLTLVLVTCVLLLMSVSHADAQWTSMGNLQGGPITAIVAWKNEIFVGTTAGGVLRSTMDGTGWSRANEGLTDTRVLTLVVKDSSLFAGTSGGGVFVSSPPGGRWEHASDGLTDSIVQFLMVDGESILAGTVGGVFHTTNDGITWDVAGDGLTGMPVRVLCSVGGMLVAGTNGDGVYISQDRGTSWSVANGGLANSSLFSLASMGNHLFAGTYGGMFRCEFPSMSWSAMVLSGSNTPTVAPMQPSGHSARTEGVAMDPATPKTVYSLAPFGGALYVGTYGTGVFRSTDFGATWSPFNTSLTNLSLYVLRAIGDRLYAGSFDGEVWAYRSATGAPALRSQGLESAAELKAWIYPNPFNAATTIAYSLANAGPVRIELFASNGTRVAVLADVEMQPAGTYEVALDAAHLASGVYLCQLTAGERHRTLRLVMTK